MGGASYSEFVELVPICVVLWGLEVLVVGVVPALDGSF